VPEAAPPGAGGFRAKAARRVNEDSYGDVARNLKGSFDIFVTDSRFWKADLKKTINIQTNCQSNHYRLAVPVRSVCLSETQSKGPSNLTSPHTPTGLLESRRISSVLEHRVLNGEPWLSISDCPANQRPPHRLHRRVCRLRWTTRNWRAMAAAAQMAAAAEAAAATVDLYIIDGRCRHLEAHDIRRLAAFTASFHSKRSDALCLFRPRSA
jgi:hypothetical protein